MVNDEFPHDAPEMGLIDNQQFVQTFFLDRANPAFGVGIRIGRTIRGVDHVNALGTEHRVKCLGE